MGWDQAKVSAPPALEWVDASGGKAAFAWSNTTTAIQTPATARTTTRLHTGSSLSHQLCAWAAITATTTSDAQSLIHNASAQGRPALLPRHKKWWADYWAQSFVSLPLTRVEGYYYTQMYRFPSSDRVGIHGLMGAFGPTGNFNFW